MVRKILKTFNLVSFSLSQYRDIVQKRSKSIMNRFQIIQKRKKGNQKWQWHLEMENCHFRVTTATLNMQPVCSVRHLKVWWQWRRNYVACGLCTNMFDWINGVGWFVGFCCCNVKTKTRKTKRNKRMVFSSSFCC